MVSNKQRQKRLMENNMIKIVIADDEERICQLIKALIDWESLGLEIVGIAHNGLEASEMIKHFRPDILITDIRMPGCSGLDLIKTVKEAVKDLEIVIISGYAHFEYAQQAIKYGVGDYLLKPISKKELTATLEKLRDRIIQRKEKEQGKQEMLRKAEKDLQRLQMMLISELEENESLSLSLQILKDMYYLNVQPGLFQAFKIKMDCGKDNLSEASASILMAKVQEELEQNLREKCTELIAVVRGFTCAGVMNYDKCRQEEIRKTMKACINQMEVQKSLFRPVTFSAAMGCAFTEPEKLGESMKEASLLIEERLVKGTGRVLEKLGKPSELNSSSILEKYARTVTHAIEVLDKKESDAAIELLENEAGKIRDVHGYEILEMVYSAADLFAVHAHMKERQAQLEKFRQQCAGCQNTEEIFLALRAFQNDYIQEVYEKHENDTIRPVRKAKQYIQNHYSEQITLEEVSNEVGLSTAYFSVLFKKTEGEGFAKYMIRVRMEQAKILLRESNIPVAEICRKVGYNDLKHFTHTFEKSVGVKPATYRKLYG